MRHLFLPVLLGLFTAPAAVAGTVYKCVDTHGQVSYQDTPCPRDSHQKVLRHLPDAAALPNAMPATTALPPPAPMPPPPPAPAPSPRITAAPPPRLFRCTRATDGDTYLSRTGITRPYLVPSGMLDWQRPLAEVYGSRQGKGVGMSAPELMPDPTPRMIGGGYYVRVHDTCRQLSPRAACKALREQYDTNEEAISRAFESDRAPLRQKRRQLRAQLAGCS